MSLTNRIDSRLRAALAPTDLKVVDESDRHAGHAGGPGHAPTGGASHVRVYIVAEAFRGKTRLDRHRMVNEALRAELADGLHALAIHASAPGE